MNEQIKQIAKEHAVILGSQVLELIGKSLIEFAAKIIEPKKETNLTVLTPQNFEIRKGSE